jgi:hypothetical protein
MQALIHGVSARAGGRTTGSPVNWVYIARLCLIGMDLLPQNWMKYTRTMTDQNEEDVIPKPQEVVHKKA